MSSLSQIQRLATKHNFSVEEVDILLRSHDAICHALAVGSEQLSGLDFLNILAHSSPYVFFFLPGDELQARTDIIYWSILPPDFSRRFWDQFFSPIFSLSEKESSLDNFIEMIAKCVRSGSDQALSIIYDCVCEASVDGHADAQALVQLCHRLAIAAQVLVSSSSDVDISFMEDTFYLKELANFFDSKLGSITKTKFIEIAKRYTPMLHRTLSSFMHNLIFHGRSTPEEVKIFQIPKFHNRSDIFSECSSSAGFLLGCLAPEVHGDNGYMSRLYSSEYDGRSLNRLMWNVLGYDGPTIIVIQTQDKSTIFGGFASTGWKVCGYQGDENCFLFQFKPSIKVFRHQGCKENHFMYCNIEAKALGGVDHLPLGLGFGGTGGLPRILVNSSFENCIASSLDGTYEMGGFLSDESLERFDVGIIEIWAVGGDSIIEIGKRARDIYRQKSDMLITRARTISDKSTFVEDLASGIIPTKLYAHHGSS